MAMDLRVPVGKADSGFRDMFICGHQPTLV